MLDAKYSTMVEGLTNRIKSLEERRMRILLGEQLTTHHWNGSDRVYECYCSMCGCHIAEKSDIDEVPLHDDAICLRCDDQIQSLKEQHKLDLIDMCKKNADQVKDYDFSHLNKPVP